MKKLKVNDEHYADLQNKMESLKTMVTNKEQHGTELQNEMCSLQMVMLKAKEICRAYCYSEMHSMKKAMERMSLIPAEQMLEVPAYVSPGQDGDTQEKLHCSIQGYSHEREQSSSPGAFGDTSKSQGNEPIYGLRGTRVTSLVTAIW
jgi:uncharacterized protein YdcH (DUF465 family)